MNLEHKCRHCAHLWKSPDASTARDIEEGGRGKGGPLCGLCYHLEFAKRYAEWRGGTLLQAAHEFAGRKSL